LLTVIQQQHTLAPNQEIVLQFQDATRSISNARTTLNNLENKLKGIGATSISIIHSENGAFKILYYSKRHISFIKAQLQSQNLIVYNNGSKSTSEKKSKDFSFDVFEIKKANDTRWDFDGQLVYKLSLKSDRSLQLKNYNTSNLTDSYGLTSLFKTQLKWRLDAVLVLNNTSYNSPEVRAGPLA
jgi:hypothetical protein